MPQHAGLRARLYYGAFVAKSVRKARKVITVSEFSSRAIQDYFGISQSKIAVAYPAADKRFHPGYDSGDVRMVREKYNIGREYILYVGLLGGWKNVEGLLAAYDIVRREADRPHELVLAGRACRATGKILDTARRLRLGESLRVLPDVDDDDLPLLYNGAAVFAFPSLHEGFGLPPLEAMRCGTPVVCTNADALPEVTGDAARLVPPGNTTALADAILEVLHDDNLRDQLISKGLRQSARFSWEKCARQLLRVFHEVASS